MKKTVLSCLIGLCAICLGGQLLLGCETWELPTRKTRRDCVKPAGNLDATIQQRQVVFSVSSSSGTIDRVTWDFGNGSTTVTTGLTTTYTYPTSSTFTAKATLSNECGTETTLLRTIGVSDATLPAVSLQPITTVANTSATAGMTITSAGNATITRYGICYSFMNQVPDESKDPKVERTGAVAMNTPLSFVLTTLEPNRLYYARSYAVNQSGISYSSPVQTFRTGQSPSVTINLAPTPGITTATVNFVASSPGFPAATGYGICYAPATVTNTPSISNSVVDVANPVIAANTVVNLTNLTPNTSYYYRPFARASSGDIIYGGVGSFTTLVDGVTLDLIASVSFTDGSLLDVSGSNNHAIPINNPIFTVDRKGRPNSAILLNGSSNYFYMAENGSLRPDAISISLWIKPATVTRSMQIYNKSTFADSKNEMYSSTIRPTGNGSPGITLLTDIKQNSGCQPGVGWQSFPLVSQLPVNTWHQVVFTYEGRSARMYFDGALLYSTDNLPATAMDKCPGGDLRFGVQLKDYPQYFDGAMDDIQMYRRAITAAEVRTLFNQ